jgi:hypothetical protein
MTETVILDPTDADVFHTDVTCGGLWVLADRAESSLGTPAEGPEALVDQAAADGLLVLDGAVGGMRRCRHCRPGTAAVAVAVWPRAA